MAEVSVIIPTFNRAELAQEAIESVLGQTLPGVEVIVVDDGSTDGTGEALRARYGERIRYFFQENQGRSVARNLGIAAAAGRYLIFLDSDDLLLPGAAAHEAAFLDTYPEVDVVYTDGYFCDEAGHDLARLAPNRPPHDPDNLLKDLILSNVILACHSAMVRRTALDVLEPPYFDPELRGAEDENLWIRLAAAGKAFAYLDVLTCKYRVHGSNASRYDPASPAYWERQKSVKRSRFRILTAGFFPELAADTRERFFHALLLRHLKGDEPAREEALSSPQFAALESAARARLLYHLGLNNLAGEGERLAGKRRLEQAASLMPGSARYRAVSTLAGVWQPVLKVAFALRRRYLGRKAAGSGASSSPITHGGLQPLKRQ